MEHLDSLINPLIKMGTSGDWTQHTRPNGIRRLSKQELEALSVEPSLSRVCTAYPDSATLMGWEFTLGDKNSEAIAVNDYANLLDLPTHTNEAQYLANVYGGAAIVLNVDDGNPPDQPIDYKKIRSLVEIEVLDCYKIRPRFQEFENINKVTHYELIMPETSKKALKLFDEKRFGNGYLIHRDRVLRFEGIRCTPDTIRDNNGWGISLLEAIYDKYARYETSLAVSSALLKDISLFLFKMQGWAKLVQNQSKSEKEESARQLNLLYLMASVFGGMIVDKEEHSLEYPSRDLNSIPEISTLQRDAFIGASLMPHTKLFGESPSGLGATGQSEERTWAQDVGAFQVQRWKKLLSVVYRVIRAASDLKERTKANKSDFDLKFHSILQLSEEETLQNRATQAQTDSTYVASQILTPLEVRQSRFGSAKYSVETTLDAESWEQMQSQSFGGENFPEEDVPEEDILVDDLLESVPVEDSLGENPSDPLNPLILSSYEKCDRTIKNWMATIKDWVGDYSSLEELQGKETELYHLLSERVTEKTLEQQNTIAHLLGFTDETW